MNNERQSNSGCLVVAPRPVRLSRNTEFNITSSQNLPNEALEEFLSILKPSFLSMPRSYNFSSGFECVSPLKHLTAASGRFSPVATTTTITEQDGRRSANTPSLDRGTCTTPIRGTWFSSSILSSPVSRMHTRNPFARNIDTRSPVQIPTKIPASPLLNPVAIPIAHVIPPSPSAVPLPVPSPDELRGLESL